MGRFSGQTFLVTGASGGVGEAIARKFGEEGATGCLTGRRAKRLEEVAAQLPGKLGRVYPADLTLEEELEGLVRQILSANQRLDVLIHGAAIIAVDSLVMAAPEDFERQFRINVLAPYRLTQLFLPALIASRGQVVFINSSSGRRARAGVGQYAATKHALRAVADSLREECNASGVRVASLFLGATATPMQAALRAGQGLDYEPKRFIQPNDVAELIASILALPRTAEVTDIMMRPMARV